MKLCAHHEAVIANLRHLDHVGDEDSARVAADLSRQCPTCRPAPNPRSNS